MTGDTLRIPLLCIVGNIPCLHTSADGISRSSNLLLFSLKNWVEVIDQLDDNILLLIVGKSFIQCRWHSGRYWMSFQQQFLTYQRWKAMRVDENSGMLLLIDTLIAAIALVSLSDSSLLLLVQKN